MFQRDTPNSLWSAILTQRLFRLPNRLLLPLTSKNYIVGVFKVIDGQRSRILRLGKPVLRQLSYDHMWDIESACFRHPYIVIKVHRSLDLIDGTGVEPV